MGHDSSDNASSAASDVEEEDNSSVSSEESITDEHDPAGNCGILYLSRIPSKMNVKLIREYFQQFADVGRIYLQANNEKPVSAKAKKRANRYREFAEGWVEITDRTLAKEIASSLNNQPVGGRRRHPWATELWNIKYLKGFKWTHLNERMAYEKAVKAKRLRLEVGQAKREAQFFSEHLQFSKKIEKTNKLATKEGNVDDANGAETKITADAKKSNPTKRHWDYKQRLPDDEHRAIKSAKLANNKNNAVKAAGGSSSFLNSLFTGGK